MTLPGRLHALFERNAPLLFLLVSAALLLTVYLFQHLGGLQPCPLCVAQRYPHFAVLGLSVAAVFASRRSPPLYAVFVAVIALAFLVGAGYAAFHVGVEGGYFGSGCAATGPASSIEDLRARLEAAPLVRCDEVAWTLFGVSMAGWNGIVSVVLGIAAGYAAVRAFLAAMKRANV